MNGLNSKIHALTGANSIRVFRPRRARSAHSKPHRPSTSHAGCAVSGGLIFESRVTS
jgi:hypothetical protein